MVVGVFAVAPVGPLLSAGLFGLFLLATGIGLQLYRRRESLAILRAMQLYMLALLAISLSYLALATSAGAIELLERTWSYPVPVSAWAIPGCYLLCLLLASYLDWSRRNKPVS
jgi:hypothetical protein